MDPTSTSPLAFLSLSLKYARVTASTTIDTGRAMTSASVLARTESGNRTLWPVSSSHMGRNTHVLVFMNRAKNR